MQQVIHLEKVDQAFYYCCNYENAKMFSFLTIDVQFALENFYFCEIFGLVRKKQNNKIYATSKEVGQN